MSEKSEKMGRCYNEIKVSRDMPTDHLVIAAAIDRLAADVEAIKEAVCGRSGWPVGWLIEVDRLIRLRDEARAEVERLKGELAARPAANPPEISDSSPAAPQPAGHGISPKVADTQSAGNAAPAAGWLTDEERQILANLLLYDWGNLGWQASVVPALNAILSRAGSPPSQTAPWWLTDRERRAVAYFAQVCREDLVPDEWTDSACVLRSILARAGSPPVVEVPELGFLVPMTGREQGIVLAYRDAMNKAGVKWKEAVRE